MFLCSKKKPKTNSKLTNEKRDPIDLILSPDIFLKFNPDTMHWENKKAIQASKKENKSPTLPQNTFSKDDKIIDKEKEHLIEFESEKMKLLNELKDLEIEYDKKNKEYLIMEIKNEILKKLIVQEEENYRKYANYFDETEAS